MGLFDSQLAWKPIDETPTGSGDTLNNIQKLTMGSGSSRFEANIKDGLWLGADTFATAPFSVNFLGALTASSVTIKTSGGTVLIDSDSSTSNYLEVLNSKMSTISKEILSDFDFGTTDYAGAVKAGDITWNTTTGAITGGSGTVVYRGGIIGAKAGVTTFSISSATGDAVFGGSLSAATGTLGALTIASGGNIKLGKTAYSDDTNAGFWMGDDSGTTKLNIGSSSSKYLHYDGTDLILNGCNIQTASASRRIVIGVDQYIRWKNGTSTEGLIYTDGSGNMKIDADNTIFISATGSGDDIYIAANDYASMSGNTVFSVANGARLNYYNDDGGSDDNVWYDDGGVAMRLDSGKDLTVADDVYADNYYDYAEFFESLDGKEIPVGTTVVTENEKIRPAKKGEQPIGLVSGSAAIILNGGSCDCGTSWGKKYLTDDYGRKIYEEVEKWYLTKKHKNYKGAKRKREHSGLVRDGNVPKGAIIKKKMIQKINPKWNDKKKYVPRKKRKEWHKIGLLGIVRINKGQPTNNNWIKLRDISKNVEEWLIK